MEERKMTEKEKKQLLVFLELGAVIVLIILGFYAGIHLGYASGYTYVVDYYEEYVKKYSSLPLKNCTCFCGGGWGQSKPGIYPDIEWKIPEEFEFEISE